MHACTNGNLHGVVDTPLWSIAHGRCGELVKGGGGAQVLHGTSATKRRGSGAEDELISNKNDANIALCGVRDLSETTELARTTPPSPASRPMQLPSLKGGIGGKPDVPPAPLSGTAGI